MILPFEPRQGLIIIKGRVRGPRADVDVRFALDTGSNVTVIGRELLEVAGYHPSDAGEHARLTSGSGIGFAPWITVDMIEAIGQQRAYFDVLAHTLPTTTPVDGLLGLDFFRGLRLIIDFRNGLLTVD